MRHGSDDRLRWLGRWSPTLFLVASAFLVVYAAVYGMTAVADPVLARNPFKFGYVFGFLGLLGLSPTVAGERQWLARAGAVAAALGVVAIVAFTTHDLAVLAGMDASETPGWFVIFVPLGLVGFLVGYLAIGVATLRSNVLPRAAGVALLLPGIIVVVMLVQIALGLTSDLQVFVISAGEGMAHLAIGSTLHAESAPTETEESSDDGEPELVTHD